MTKEEFQKIFDNWIEPCSRSHGRQLTGKDSRFWYELVKNVPCQDFIDAFKYLSIQRQFMPTPHQVMQVVKPPDDNRDYEYEEWKRQDEAKYRDMMSRHREEIDEIINQIQYDAILNEKHREIVDNVNVYAGYMFGERDHTKELWTKKTPYTMSYKGLLGFALSGQLKRLKGEPKGDVKYTKSP